MNVIINTNIVKQQLFRIAMYIKMSLRLLLIEWLLVNMKPCTDNIYVQVGENDISDRLLDDWPKSLGTSSPRRRLQHAYEKKRQIHYFYIPHQH